MIKVKQKNNLDRSFESSDFIEIIQKASKKVMNPFDNSVLELLDLISKKIFRSKQSKNFPASTALAFWLRKSSIHELKKSFTGRQQSNTLLAARGMCLHLPPSNVDTIFVYSWAVSILCGNATVCRIPDNQSEEINFLLEIILNSCIDLNLNENFIFCNYPYGNSIEKEIGSFVDVRVIWGGDEKVKTVSSIPIKPAGISIGFPNRNSYSLLNLENFKKLKSESKQELALNLFNDVYWFDQLGCGSPKLLFLLNSDEKDIHLLGEELQKIISKKNYKNHLSGFVEKFVFANHGISEGSIGTTSLVSNELFMSEAKKPSEIINNFSGGGYMSYLRIEDSTEIGSFLDDTTQTITHYGFNYEEIKQLATNLKNTGGLRFVPLGEALKFDVIWDGLNLFDYMTKTITFR